MPDRDLALKFSPTLPCFDDIPTGHQSPAGSSDSIRPGDVDTGGDELPQSFFDFDHAFRIATMQRNDISQPFQENNLP